MTRQEFEQLKDDERSMLFQDAVEGRMRDLAKDVAHVKRTSMMELGVTAEDFDASFERLYKTEQLKFDQMSDFEFKLMTIAEGIAKGAVSIEDLKEED